MTLYSWSCCLYSPVQEFKGCAAVRKLCTFHCMGKIYCLFSTHACFPISFFYQVASHRTRCATHGSVCHPLTRSSRPVSESSWGTLPSFPIAQLFLPNKRKNEVSGEDSPLGRLDKQMWGWCHHSEAMRTTYLGLWRFWSAPPLPASRKRQDGSSAGTPSFQSSLHPWSSSRQWGLVPGPGRLTALWWNNSGRLSRYLKAILVHFKITFIYILCTCVCVRHIYVH